MTCWQLSRIDCLHPGTDRPHCKFGAACRKVGGSGKAIPNTLNPVTNGDFATPLYQHGFDWRQIRTPGIHFDQIASDKLVRFEFSGDEPEQCPLLQQYLPLQGGRDYTLQWRKQSGLQQGPSGLRWTLTTIGKSPETQVSSTDLAVGQKDSWHFQLPAGTTLGLLTLQYERPLGQGRVRGAFVLEDVSAHAE